MEENKEVVAQDELSLLREANKKLQSDCQKLNNIAVQLSQQNEMLVKKNKELEAAITENEDNKFYTNLSFYFKVAENPDKFTAEIVSKCLEAIEDSLFPKE